MGTGSLLKKLDPPDTPHLNSSFSSAPGCPGCRPLFLLHPNPGGLPMPRIARFVRPDTPTVYHVISRTALDGFPLGDREKDHLLDTIRFLSRFYFAEVLGFCMGIWNMGTGSLLK
jgi:hypothetical protein